MSAERHARAKAVFLAALEVPEAERAAFVASRCGGGEDGEALAAEVTSLLAHASDAPLLREPERRPEPPRGAADDPLGLVGAVLDERYRVEAFVAEGGFSFVYRARQIRWDRAVALKLFKVARGAEEEVRAAFLKEGALLAELSRHTTAIVQSYDVGTWVTPAGEPVLFTALEWLEGQTLGALVAAERRAGAPPWPIARVLEVLGPVAEALAVAHAAGVAHRDVKPGNIVMVEAGDRRATKLLDFGVAKVAAEHERGFQGTGGQVRAFTIGYAAPEQLSKRHGPTGPWTDVYALALLCVELLAGRAATGEEDAVRALRRFFDADARPTPARLGFALPRPLDAVLERALALEPAARFPDAAAFWRALVEAARPTPRRGWWPLAVGAALLAGAAAVIAAMTMR